MAVVHLLTLFMAVPISNAMSRIDRSLLEAAADAGSTGWQTLWHVIVPLAGPAIIFVVTLVMGDVITVRFMSGSQSANAGRLIFGDSALLQYPLPTATAAIMPITVLIVLGILLRFFGARNELQDGTAQSLVLPAVSHFRVVPAVSLRADDHHHDPTVPRAAGRVDLTDARHVDGLFPGSFSRTGHRR